MSDNMHAPNIGSMPSADAKRDAIHIAVASIVAAEVLSPGQPVGCAGTSADPVGVVDPFLTKDVAVGERFWMFIRPNTITSLRHEWTHPGFAQTSENWLREFAKSRNDADDGEPFNYDKLINGAKKYLRDGYETLNTWGETELPPEFWLHFEAVTGEKASTDRREGTFLGCCI